MAAAVDPPPVARRRGRGRRGAHLPRTPAHQRQSRQPPAALKSAHLHEPQLLSLPALQEPQPPSPRPLPEQQPPHRWSPNRPRCGGYGTGGGTVSLFFWIGCSTLRCRTIRKVIFKHVGPTNDAVQTKAPNKGMGYGSHNPNSNPVYPNPSITLSLSQATSKRHLRESSQRSNGKDL